jgi:hypothetical protein
MRDPDLCLHDGECYEEAVYCQKHYNALAARLAEAERLLRRVPYITPVKKLHQDIGEFLRTADSADDGLLADRVHKDGKLYRERR